MEAFPKPVCLVVRTVHMAVQVDLLAHMLALVDLTHLPVATPQPDRVDHRVLEECGMRRNLLDLSGLQGHMGPTNRLPQAVVHLAVEFVRFAFPETQPAHLDLSGHMGPTNRLPQAVDLLAVECVQFAFPEAPKARQVQPAHMDLSHQADHAYGSFCRCVVIDESELKLEFRKRQLVASNSG